MDAETKAKWAKVRDALAAAGKTDSYIYRRALAITSGLPDPGPFGPYPIRR